MTDRTDQPVVPSRAPGSTTHLDRDVPPPTGLLPSPLEHRALSFGAADQLLPSLKDATVELPGHSEVTVQLRLVEAGHQVVLNAGGARWVETFLVAESIGTQTPLTTRHGESARAELTYESRCTVTEHSPRGLRKQRMRVLDTCAAATASLTIDSALEPEGHDNPHPEPGDSPHGSGLCVFGFNDADEILWRSWHIQPGGHRLVQTTSTVWLADFSSSLPRAS